MAPKRVLFKIFINFFINALAAVIRVWVGRLWSKKTRNPLTRLLYLNNKGLKQMMLKLL